MPMMGPPDWSRLLPGLRARRARDGGLASPKWRMPGKRKRPSLASGNLRLLWLAPEPIVCASAELGASRHSTGALRTERARQRRHPPPCRLSSAPGWTGSSGRVPPQMAGELSFMLSCRLRAGLDVTQLGQRQCLCPVQGDQSWPSHAVLQGWGRGGRRRCHGRW